MSKQLTNKPLKGTSVTGNLGVFDTLQVSNLVIDSDALDTLLAGTALTGVTIVDSVIQNTVIGAQGPNEGHFTTLTTTSDLTFLSNDGSSSVNWDPIANTFVIGGNGSLVVEGCATIGNISLCGNTIRAINSNGDLKLIPEGIGSIFLTGPVTNIVNSYGNYITSLADGSITMLSSDYINLTSQSSSSSITSFSDQIFTTINGDISLNTQTGTTNKFITNIIRTAGNLKITTSTPSQVRVGDFVTLSDTNSVPNVDGSFYVKSIINSTSFTISTGSFGLTSNGSIGSLYNPPMNNINLNAAVYVKIPENIKLIFGNTENSISGNTSGLIFNSIGGNAVFNIPSVNTSFLQIPQNTKFQYGTSGSNYMNFDGNSMNINSYNNININGNESYINSSNIFLKDANPMISNFTQFNGDTSDRGIQFNYWSGGTAGNSTLGWFGYKQSSGKFVLLTDAINTNEVFTGTPGKFDIGDISTTSITINQGSFINVNCGNLLNVNTITGCGGTVNINSSSNVNITTGTRLALISGGDIFIPNNIPLKMGTSGSYIVEGTIGNIWLTGSKNILLNTQTNGSVIIQPNVKISFDGNSVGNRSIFSDTTGNLNINTNNNINLTTTAGNIIIPRNTSGNSSGFPSIQFGSNLTSLSTATETISGSTRGIFINSISSRGTLNLISNSNVNISSSTGNVNITTLAGDIQLFTTIGNTRIYQSSYLVFGISGTNNSIRSNSIGNLILNGPGTSIGNLIELKNTGIINLSANNAINIPISVPINLDNGLGNRYIISDTNSNILMSNTNSSSGIFITSLNTAINNNGGVTSILNNNTNISTSTFTLTGTNTFINSTNIKMIDPILSLANYTLVSNDLKDRGIEYSYYSTTGSMKLGWFGYKNNTGQFTFYSDAINTGEIISGTLGQFALGSVVVSNDINFVNAGNINMNCGTISNLNTIMGCGGNINILTSQNMNISSSNIFLTANTAGKVLIPNNVPLSFGSTNNSVSTDTNGNMSINVNNGSGTLILNSNVQINGTTNNVFSTVTNVQDPIFSIGGVTGPILDDLKDRGIEFKWYGSTGGTIGSKTGFFGFDNSTKRFTYLPESTNTNEIISGVMGDVQFANGFYNNLDVNCGTVSNISVLTACSGQGLSIISTNGINLSSANIILPSTSKIIFGSTSNSISGTSSGALNINSNQNTTITSNTGGIIFNTSTSGNGFTQFSKNSPMYFGSQSSGNFLNYDTNGNFNITNTSGDIYLSPYTNNISNSFGNVIIPTNDNLVFGNSTTRISSDGTNLQLYGYSIGINSTTTITFNGNVNIVGTVSSVDSGKYIQTLGTSQQLSITSIVNSTTAGNILVTTDNIHYLIVGDKVTLKNTDSTPTTNSNYTVNQIINNRTFSVANIPLSEPGTTGVMYGVLKVYQGKDIGIEVDYWSTVGNTSVTAGSVNYKTAFFGWLNNTQQWTYYSNATIQNNIVTSGILGDIRVNELYANKISGFTLDGPIVGGTYIIAGSNFQISGGQIDNTPIGQTNAQTGRFTTLASTVSTSLQNVTMQSNLNYSIDRYTLTSLIPTRSPSTSTIISYITISGSNITCTGTMGTTGLTDGQVKKIVMSSVSSNCEYHLAFASGKLITPNPLGGPLPTRMRFKRQGQSAEIIYDASLLAWVLNSGTGCYIE